MADKLRVTQIKSTISHIARNRATIRALGLKRIGHTVEILLPVGERPVHGVHPPGEPRVEQVVQHTAAHPARGAARADDGDGAGREQPLHGPRLGALFPGALHGERAVGGLQVEFQAYDAVLEAAFLGVPGVREDFDHLAVRGQHLGGEAPDVPFPGDGGDVLQEGGGDPAALVGVLYQEGDFGLVGGGGGGHAVGVDAVVAYGGDELAAYRGREADPVHEVVVGEAMDVFGGQPWVWGEEAVVLRLVRDLFVEADQTVGGDHARRRN